MLGQRLGTCGGIPFYACECTHREPSITHHLSCSESGSEDCRETATLGTPQCRLPPQVVVSSSFK